MFRPLATFGTDAVMQTDDTSTLETGSFFFKYMLSCANSFDSKGIFDQTHLISLPVAFVKPLDGCTRKRRTLETKIDPMSNCAISSAAFPAVIRLAVFLPSTTLAWFLLSEMCITNRAIHPTRSQHGYRYFCIHLHERATLFRCLTLRTGNILS